MDEPLPLPPIENWWPYLSVGARHEVRGAPDRDLSRHVRAEIERALGIRVPLRAHLTSDDQRFVDFDINAAD